MRLLLILNVCMSVFNYPYRVYVDILRGALEKSSSYEYFSQIQTTEAKECLRAAEETIQSFNCLTDAHNSFSKWLVSKLELIVDSAKKRNAEGINREKLWVNYHKETSFIEFTSKWNDFCSKIKVVMTPLFYQHITDEIFEYLIKDEFDLNGPNGFEEQTPHLTFEEENAVHFVGGYVLRVIKEDPKNLNILPLVLKLINIEKNSHVGSSQEWLVSIDRGGLIDITDEAFQCFYSIELVIRRYFNSSRTRDMVDGFTDEVNAAVLQDDDVLFNWCLAVGLALGCDYDETISESCLKQIVRKWVTIRGHSFSKSMMEMYKQSSKKGTDKSKPLRCKIFNDNTD